jgi:hypothetical protein
LHHWEQDLAALLITEQSSAQTALMAVQHQENLIIERRLQN